MSELIAINVVIGDRNYRIKIAPADEEKVRRTVKNINDKIVEFKTQFAGKDMQDYISMVMIWYATQTDTQNPASSFLAEAVAERLTGIEKQIDKVLAGSQG